MDKNSSHFKGTYRNVYEVNRAYPNGGVFGDYVDINGWQHWWNPDRGTWCVNENRDTYWDEVLATIQNLVWSKGCTSESDFPSSPTEDERRTAYFYNGQLYLWTGTNGTIRNGQYRSFGVVQGERGVGVSSIAQTSTSNVDGGKNEITVTLTNGDSYKFFTYNGTGRNKGYYYKSLDELKQAVPTPSVTDWAVVDGSVYVCEEDGVWKDTTYSWKPIKLNPFVTELNKLSMPTTSGYLHWNGQSFSWRNPVVSGGGSGDSGGGTSVDLTQYSWWGRTFGDGDTGLAKKIWGNMDNVTSIGFMDMNGKYLKYLQMDDDGNLYFDGNFYATGGITALGSGGSSSGGGSSAGGGSLKIFGNSAMVNGAATILNFKYPSSLSDVVKSSGDGVVDIDLSKITGITIKRNGEVMQDTNGATMSCTSINFAFPLEWGTVPVTRSSNDEIKVDLQQIADNIAGSGGSGSTASLSKLYIPNTAGTVAYGYNGSSAIALKFGDGLQANVKTISVPGVGSVPGIEVTATGGGSSSGGSGTTSGRLYFTKGSSQESFNGESNFEVVFGDGINATWTGHTKVTISASGGSSSGGSSSVDLSSYLTKTDAASTYLGKTATAAAATKLATARTIWGQSFNGTANVSGDMSNVGHVSISGTMKWGSGTAHNSTSIELYGASTQKTPFVDFHYYTGSEVDFTARLIADAENQLSLSTKSGAGIFNMNLNKMLFGSSSNYGTIEWDATNKAFKINGNVYATGGVTALGVTNDSTTSNNVDFTFNSVTANKYIVKDAIWLSESLYLERSVQDFVLCSNDNDEHYFYLDGQGEAYFVSSNGNAFFKELEAGKIKLGIAEEFRVSEAGTNTFTIKFVYNGKTYSFTPSSGNVSIS